MERAVECASCIVFVRISALAARFASVALCSDPALRGAVRQHGVELLVFQHAPAVAVSREAARISTDALERWRDALRGEGQLTGGAVSRAEDSKRSREQEGAGGVQDSGRIAKQPRKVHI